MIFGGLSHRMIYNSYPKFLHASKYSQNLILYLTTVHNVLGVGKKPGQTAKPNRNCKIKPENMVNRFKSLGLGATWHAATDDVHFHGHNRVRPSFLFSCYSDLMISLGRQMTAYAAVTARPTAYRQLFTTSGAAQPQLDLDYYSDCNDSNSSYPMAETESSVPRRGVQWAFIGYPRVKRRVYVETLSKLLEVPYISMATLVRQELNPGTSLYKQIANAVNRGQIVPEDIIFGLLSKRLEDGYYRGETGFILDGIPRSRLQAEVLDELVEIDLVVNVKCTDDFLIQHQEEAAWKSKLQAYVEQSKPLEDYYRKQKKLLDFQVGNAPGETWQRLLAALQLQHVDALYCSNKLTGGSYTLL
ncbi:probable adenylate kinase 7, mitochondrial [Mercurialis annua]|uniref:probable adenylate kinase 7, mitochondrial n=1 Tax=Mercurialis annua TaxID=3986 RepID=UPI002160F127|nr:probable adenylate kinase 7, mitochondrial [Mercurialis annua]